MRFLEHLIEGIAKPTYRHRMKPGVEDDLAKMIASIAVNNMRAWGEEELANTFEDDVTSYNAIIEEAEAAMREVLTNKLTDNVTLRVAEAFKVKEMVEQGMERRRRWDREDLE